MTPTPVIPVAGAELPSPVVPRPAALLILARDGEEGLEVFMLQRTGKADFVPGANVFPGGGVDAADSEPGIAAFAGELNDATASAALGLPAGGLGYWVGAVRECFEEAGLLLAQRRDGDALDFAQPEVAARFAELRRALNAGRTTFAELCAAESLRLTLDRMVYFAHWITPVGMNRRYDTRFFVAPAPLGQLASHDEAETVDSVWIRPADALERHAQGSFSLVYATRETLQALSGFATVADLMAHARGVSGIAARMPRVGTGPKGRHVVGPRDACYAELGFIDPHGHGQALCQIVPGTAVRLAGGVWRLTAANPSYMTGPGTNTYLLGDAEGVTVIDPGPADPEHVRAILAHAPGPITQILVTHTHSDHSPAAALLKAQTGASVIGLPAPPGIQDQTFAPEYCPEDGDSIPTRAGALQVLHTPGHASNHLCYLHPATRLLFSGDHIMQGSTVVINPPDGDMLTYLASLERLLAEDIGHIAPAHGFLMDDPQGVVRDLIAHRLRREAVILRALQADGPASTEMLLPRVYAHISGPLKKVAARSLQAHLDKLDKEGKVSLQDGVWHATNAGTEGG